MVLVLTIVFWFLNENDESVGSHVHSNSYSITTAEDVSIEILRLTTETFEEVSSSKPKLKVRISSVSHSLIGV